MGRNRKDTVLFVGDPQEKTYQKTDYQNQRSLQQNMIVLHQPSKMIPMMFGDHTCPPSYEVSSPSELFIAWMSCWK